MWKMFMSAGGAEINNLIYWVISLIIWFAPQLALWSRWNLTVKTQYRAQIIIRGKRQNFWLLEGKYIIPFFKQLFDINVSEIHKTSKIDVKIPQFKTHDVKGEELLAKVQAEKQIDEPSVYAEFDEDEMAEDVKGILLDATIREVRRKNFWTQILGHEDELDIEDDIFKRQCRKYGIKLVDIVISVTNADTSSENRVAKRKRIVDALIKEKKDETGKDKLTDSDMKEIHDQTELIMKLISEKRIIQGIPPENIHYRAGD